MEAVAAAAGVDAPLPMGPFPERALRPLLADTSGLDRLEAARDAVAAAPRERRRRRARPARPRVRGGHRPAGGARRGRQRRRAHDRLPGLHARPRRDARPGGARRAAQLAAAGARTRRAGGAGACSTAAPSCSARIAHGRSGPLAPLLGQLMGAGFGLWNQMGDEQRELQRRWAASRRRADAFADWTPAWHGSAYHSADLQIAAPSTDALARGDFLIVLGDFHGGDNPLAQGLFGLRHPDPAAMLRRIAAEAGPGVHLSPPRRGVVEMTARSWPLYPRGRHRRRRAATSRRPPGTRRVALEDVVVDDGHVSDRAGTLPRPARAVPLPADLRRRAAQLRPGRRARRAARRSAASSSAARPGRRPPPSCRRRRTTSPPGRASAASRAASSPARRSSASRATSTSRARRCAARSPASSRPPASRRRARRRVHRDAPRPGATAGSRATPATTRASCASSPSTVVRITRQSPGTNR